MAIGTYAEDTIVVLYHPWVCATFVCLKRCRNVFLAQSAHGRTLYPWGRFIVYSQGIYRTLLGKRELDLRANKRGIQFRSSLR